MTSKLVLLSGGPDSAVAAFRARKQGTFDCLTVVNNARGANSAEVSCAQQLADLLQVRHTLVDLSSLTELFRDIPNMQYAVGGEINNCVRSDMSTAPLSVETMHMAAMMYAISHQIPSVVWSMHRDDLTQSVEDFHEYVNLLERLVELRAQTRCRIELPLIHMSKAEVLEEGCKLGVPFESTFSCSVNQSQVHCGQCVQCVKRIRAFSEAGLVDHAQYEAVPVLS